jgi:ATP-dependent protease La (LON) substrate-binding domain
MSRFNRLQVSIFYKHLIINTIKIQLPLNKLSPKIVIYKKRIMFNKKIEIPFFPLEIALLPSDITPLRIFEPRYIQLINDVVENNSTFGIPFVKNSIVQDFGSEVRVTEILKRKANGEMIITIEGIRNFKVVDFKMDFYNKLYNGGLIKHLINKDIVVNDKISGLIDNLKFKLKTQNKNEVDLFEIASLLKLNDIDKFNFLSLDEQEFKEEYIIKRLNYYKLLKKQEDLLQKNFSLN